ncbi:MAG: AIR synthase-related protein, partial [Leptospiraceae bacterium]|nr:AIR synthase-related protein [Leptospiraceae bacterium]
MCIRDSPGIMKEDEYDLAGFAVGVVEKEEMITGDGIQEGDVLIGIESSGPHSNGYSLLRKLYLEEGKYLPNDKEKLLFIMEYLMQPTKIYVEPILKLLQREEVKGMVHITGGGFYENIPRVLPPNVGVKIELDKFPISYTFSKIIKDNSLDTLEMFGVFNMGIGFVLICKEQSVNEIISILHQLGEKAHWIGKVTKGNKEVIIA